MGEYNEIYDKLVESDVDFIGLIAYGLYKRGKRKHIVDLIKQKRRRPTDEEIASFVSMAMGQLELYKSMANDIFAKVVANAVQAELEQSHERQKLVELILSEAKAELNNVEKNYENTIEPIIKKHTFSFWGTVWVNIVSAIVLPLGAFVLILIICLLFPSFPEYAKELIRTIGS